MGSELDTSDRMSMDLVFEILSNTRRRMVLYYLRQDGGTSTIQKLAEQIAVMENDTRVEQLSSQQRKRVYVSLYQTHIPKLEETGIIEYDDDEGEVYLTDRAVEIDSYLTPTTESEYQWQIHYLALAGIGGLLLFLSSSVVAGVSVLPTLWIGIGLMVAFALSAIVQFWWSKRNERAIPVELMEQNQ